MPNLISKAKDLPAPVRLWLRPVEDALDVIADTSDKRLGDFTMPELVAWGYVLGYCLASGFLIGNVAGNLARVALRGQRG